MLCQILLHPEHIRDTFTKIDKIYCSQITSRLAKASFCLWLGVSSDYAQPITGQVTEVTCPVIGRAQPELTPSKRQKMNPDWSHHKTSCQILKQFPQLPYRNSSPPGQYGRHFADNIFRCIFMNEKFCILIQISLKFVPKGPIDNSPALVQIMAWRRIGDKPLSEPILTRFTDTYMQH